MLNDDKNIVIALIKGNSELSKGSSFYIIDKKLEEIWLEISENKIIWKDTLDNFINEKDIEGNFRSLSSQMLGYSQKLKELPWDKKIESLNNYVPELTKDFDNLILIFKDLNMLILKQPFIFKIYENLKTLLSKSR